MKRENFEELLESVREGGRILRSRVQCRAGLCDGQAGSGDRKRGARALEARVRGHGSGLDRVSGQNDGLADQDGVAKTVVGDGGQRIGAGR